MPQSKMAFHVETVRLDTGGSRARCKQAELILDTDLAGDPHAFNPAELLLAALTGCIIKGIERVTPILRFELRGVKVRVDGVRQVLWRVIAHQHGGERWQRSEFLLPHSKSPTRFPDLAESGDVSLEYGSQSAIFANYTCVIPLLTQLHRLSCSGSMRGV